MKSIFDFLRRERNKVCSICKENLIRSDVTISHDENGTIKFSATPSCEVTLSNDARIFQKNWEILKEVVEDHMDRHSEYYGDYRK